MFVLFKKRILLENFQPYQEGAWTFLFPVISCLQQQRQLFGADSFIGGESQ